MYFQHRKTALSLFLSKTGICGDETVSLAYRIIGNKPSEGSQWEKIKARVSSVEGVTLDFDIYYFCRSLKGQLEADISSIKTTMTKGTSRDYSFTIANRGKGETGAIVLGPSSGRLDKSGYSFGDAFIEVWRVYHCDSPADPNGRFAVE
ncbi:hypothetical protein NXV73_25630 [Bacteroides salyersiae]|nr:hypothetical protein [Bacteroides salyersiae]